MPIRVLPDFLVNQIAAGEVVERPASVVKELVENALDAGADNIVIDVVDGGRTLISVIDNGGGMSRDDLAHCVMRHATSKLPSDDLLNINFMGFRGEALPSIASVSDMVIDTYNGVDENGWQLDCATGEIRPSAWDSGTRIRVQNLFANTPARLKFLHSDRAELMAVVDVVKRLAMARSDVGFVLNNKWFFAKGQELSQRVVAVMGEDVRGQMLTVDAKSESNDKLALHGFISQPTLRRASSVDQYLFVNGRPVRDKVLVGALRASYMDVMHAREFPLCALYLTLDPRSVDVNVSPAKTDVHFLEPAHVRAFIIKTVRNALARTVAENLHDNSVARAQYVANPVVECARSVPKFNPADFRVCAPIRAVGDVFKNNSDNRAGDSVSNITVAKNVDTEPQLVADDRPLGRVIGQIGNKYILAQSGENLVIVDQHAGHERITYERMRQHNIKVQPLLTPIVVSLRPEDALAVMSVADQLRGGGLVIDDFGDSSIAVFEKPADWDLDWNDLFHAIADEVREYGASAQLGERLHLKLANYACHHSVRNQMDTLLRDIEKTVRGGECNHGRPVYKIIPLDEIDTWFERA